jgi:putative ABC transport system permease protein
MDIVGLDDSGDHRSNALRDLRQDIWFASRLLRRERAFTLTIVIVLALGIAVTGTFFTLMNGIVFRGLPLDGVERVVVVSSRDAQGQVRPMSFADFEDVKSAARAFRQLAAFSSGPMTVADADQPAERVAGAYVSAGLLTLLGENPILGRDLQALDDRQGAAAVVILGRSLWQRRYAGRAAVVGETVRVNGMHATVVGVMPERSKFPTNAELWLPLAHRPGLFERKRDARSLSVFGWLGDGRTVQSAVTELRGIASRLSEQYADTNQHFRFEAVPVNEQYLGTSTHPAWFAFIAAGTLVLLIACANIANLLLMRSVRRTREIAVRLALGATRGRVTRQLLAESLVLAALGGTVGLALSFSWTHVLTTRIPRDTFPHWMLPVVDSRVLLTMAAVCVTTTVVFGLVPSLHASKATFVGLLREGGRVVGRGKRTSRLTTALLVAQIGLAMVLMANLALSIRGQRSLARQDPPIEMSRLLTASISLQGQLYTTPVNRVRFYRDLEMRLGRDSGIQSMAVASSLPLEGGPSRSFEVDGNTTPSAKSERMSTLLIIGEKYFSTLGVSLVQGRTFEENDREVAIVNQEFANIYFPQGDILNRRIRVRVDGSPMAKSWLMIVGVSPDIRQQTGPEPVVYVPYALEPPVVASLIVRGRSAPETMASPLRYAVRDLDPDLALYRVTTMNDAVDEANWNARMSHLLQASIVFIAIVLSGVGLYAVTSHGVALRVQEMTIRLALGASGGHLVLLVLRAAAVQLCMGLGVGVLAVLAWSRAFPAGYGQVALTDPEGLTMACVLLGTLCMTACIIPAIHASRLRPSVILRYE